MRPKVPQKEYGAVWNLVFLSLITEFSSPITQNQWVPWSKHLFGFVLSFCFHHLILTKLSDELQKLETSYRCFQVMEIELWWHFGNFTQLMPAFTPPTALFIPDQTPFASFQFLQHPSINFFLFSSQASFSIPTGSCSLSSRSATPAEERNGFWPTSPSKLWQLVSISSDHQYSMTFTVNESKRKLQAPNPYKGNP